MGAIPGIFAEFGSRDSLGRPIDLSSRKTIYNYTSREGENITGESRTSITENEASALTYANMIPGEDGWDPRGMMSKLPVPANIRVDDVTVSWDAVNDARG